jgi:uncharacterized protein
LRVAIFYNFAQFLYKGQVDKLTTYDIAYKGLPDGQHVFEYNIDRSFFELIDDSLIEDGRLLAKIDLHKQTTMLTLNFDIKGVVNTICDRCLDPLELKVSHKARIYIKFGDVYDEPTEEIIVLPHEEYQYNVAQLIYEFIGLSMPMQKVHKNNGCDPSMIARLEHINETESDDSAESDPRWGELKKLLDKNK